MMSISARGKTYCAMLLLLIAGSILRLYGLGKQPLWNDELDSWWRSRPATVSNIVARVVESDMHPPLYAILLHQTTKYFGDSEFAMRLPSAIAGILSIGALFLLALYLYSLKEAVISSLFLAVTWTGVYYSQEARMYSILLLFVLLSTLCLAVISRAIINKSSIPKVASLCFLFTALVSAYLHYFGLFFSLLQISLIIILSIKKHKYAYAVLMTMCFVGAYFPWLKYALSQFHGAIGEIGWIKPMILLNSAGLVAFAFNGVKFLAVVIICASPFFFIKLFKAQQQNRRSDLFIISWLVVPFLGVYIWSKLFYPIFTPRNMMIILPAVYLFVSRIIISLPVRLMLKWVIVALIVAFLITDLVFIKKYYFRPDRDGFRQVADFISKNSPQGVNMRIIGYLWQADFMDYYLIRAGLSRRAELVAGRCGDISKLNDYLHKSGCAKFWYIYAHQPPDAEFVDFLMSNYRLVKGRVFAHSGAWLFNCSRQ